MKNNVKFENSTSSGGQTHVFTSFPETHIDDDNDSNFLADSNKQSEVRLLDENFLADDGKTTNYSVWQIEYYQKYFNVSTNEVLARISGSIVPTFNQNFLINKIRPNPDLYGPFWICTTLIFTIAISGNMYSFLSNFGTPYSWQTDFHKLTTSAFVIIIYWWLAPTFLYITLKWRALVADFQFVEILCVYGYSLFVFIPVSILWLIHISIIQWVLVLMAIALSGSVLLFTFWPTFSQDSNKKVAYGVMVIILAMHSLLAIGFMLYFFHSPAHFDPKTTTFVTSTVPTTIANVNTTISGSG